MANAMYSLAKEQFLGGDLDWDAGIFRAVMVDTGIYTFSAAHTSYDDLAGAVVFTESAALGTKTKVGGVADAADITFTAATGTTVEALVVFYDSGTSSTDTLICYIDVSPTITPNGTNIDVTWNASGIFAI